MGAQTFYDKLLPVPLLNLLVRQIDRLTAPRPAGVLAPSSLSRALTPAQRNLVYTSMWAVVFVAMSALKAVGDTHPGQYLPFWQKACQAGSARACTYAANLTAIYCSNGSGWACNEVAILRLRLRQPAGPDFRRGCDLGFSPACENARRAPADSAPVARARPLPADLPIVLRGTKPTLRERDPARLSALACAQGWLEMCTHVP
jgi:hypothetical protein